MFWNICCICCNFNFKLFAHEEGDSQILNIQFKEFVQYDLEIQKKMSNFKFMLSLAYIMINLVLADEDCLISQQSSIEYPIRTSSTHNGAFIKKVQYSIEIDQTNNPILKASLSVSQGSGSNLNLVLKTFSLPILSNWSIIYTSPSEWCVIMNAGSNLKSAATTAESLRYVQSVNYQFKKVKSIRLSQDCTKIEIIGKDEQMHYFYQSDDQGSILPTTMAYSADWLYGVAGKVLYKFQGISYTTTAIYSQNVYSQIVSVKYSNQKEAVLIISKESGKSSLVFGVLVYNLQKKAVQWSDSYQLSQNQENFKVQTSVQMDTVLIRSQLRVIELLSLKKEGGSVNIIIDSIVYAAAEKTYLDKNTASSLIHKILIILDASQQTSKEFIFHILKIDSQTKNAFYQGSYPLSNTQVLIQNVIDNLRRNDFLVPIQAESRCLAASQQIPASVICHIKCLQCLQAEICLECQLGYQLLRGRCVQCEDCKSCDPMDTTKCRSCFQPQYFLDQGQKCVQFLCNLSDCRYCDKNNVCSECRTGFGLLQNTCQKCTPSNCEVCSINKSICEDCSPGYTLYDGQCMSCALGCAGCSAQRLGQCSSCVQGYYRQLDPKNKYTCNLCKQDCQVCTSKTTCLSCKSDYQFNELKTKCIPQCVSGCKYCLQTDPFKCTSCRIGYTFNSTAQTCQASLVCNANADCQVCPAYYVLISASKTCLKCQVQDSKCTLCNPKNLTKCQACVKGYFIGNEKTCVKCHSQCVTCYTLTACSTCSDGYYLVKVTGQMYGQCLACQHPCKTCTIKSFMCTSCRQGYELVENKCRAIVFLFFELQLKISMARFSLIYNKLIQMILELGSLSDSKLTESGIIIQKIDGQDQVKVTGSIGSRNQTISKLKQSIDTLWNKTIDGVWMGMVYTQCKNTTSCSPTPQQSPSEESNDLSLAMPIAVAGSLVVIIVIGLTVYFKFVKAANAEEHSNSQATEESSGTRESINDIFTGGVPVKNIHKIDELI